MSRLKTVLAAGMALALMAAGPAAAAPPKTGSVEVQFLGLNDFHGNLEPPQGGSGRIVTGTDAAGAPTTTDAGGVEYLATHLERLRAQNRNTVTVSAGDLIGASPLLSALFHDEPTIEAMNLAGLDFNAVGNHEFDEGAEELKRMQAGGCHPTDGCLDGDPFEGADFRFLGANVVAPDGSRPFPSFKTRHFQGVKVGFIGMTLEATPTIVSPAGIRGYDFRDEADTVNRLVPVLKRRGVETIVVMIHEGGVPALGSPYNGCTGISGPIVDIVNRMSDDVDAVFSGHTHQAYNCVIDGRPVTSASSFGRLVTDVDMVIDRATGNPTSVRANNTIVTRDVPKDAEQTALIEKYRAVATPIANRVIGSISADITRTPNAAGESALGDVIADAQLDATSAADRGGAQIAFMNPGGIRTDLTFAGSPAGEGDGRVTYAEGFTVQPFGNSLVTLSLTGAQIETLLEQQWAGQAFPRVLQPSRGFSYTWDASKPAGDRVDPATIKLNGVTLDPTASYRVTVNSFLADGGDNFAVLTQGGDRLGGDVDVDALEKYLVAAGGPVVPGAQDRITVVGAPAP